MASNYIESWTPTLAALGQLLVELQPANKQALLLKASLQIHERREEAEAILDRLRRLNASVASLFVPKQDVTSKIQLRLISSPTAQQEIPTTFDSFIAVSYCWHYPEWELPPAAHPIAPGWEISRPMVDAVMDMRNGANEGVWLDKLCINQNDPQDKMMHIGAMDIVYRSPRRIIILLEDIQLTDDEEMAGLAYRGFYADMVREVNERDLQGQVRSDFIMGYFPPRESSCDIQNLQGKAYRFAMKILDARWFTRAWCAHESRVTTHSKTNNPLILCYSSDGHVISFEFRFLHYLSMHISDAIEESHSLVGEAYYAVVNDPKPRTLRQMSWRMLRLMLNTGDVSVKTTSTLADLVSVMASRCKNKGDLMSIALNTAGLPLAFSGDITVIQDVVWIFTLLVLAKDDVTPLFVDGGKLRIPDIEAPGSTTISWAVRPQERSFDRSVSSPRMDTITSVTRDYIEMDLIVFESKPSAPSGEAFKVAMRMMEEYSLANLLQETEDEQVLKQYSLIGTVGQSITSKTPYEGPLKNFIPKWIAHAIDCGLEWTLRFPDVMKSETEDSYMHGTMGEHADERLVDAASFLLDHLISHGGSSIEERDRHRDVQGLTRFLTCVLDRRLAFFTINPRRLSVGNGDFAIISSMSNRSWVAIPAAVAHLPAWQKRAWVIEPFNPSSEALQDSQLNHLPDINMTLNGDESAEDVFPVLDTDYADKRRERGEAWQLRKKDEIYGCQRLSGTEDQAVDGAVLYLKNQRVFGSEDYDWGAIYKAVHEFEMKHGRMYSSLVRST